MGSGRCTLLGRVGALVARVRSCHIIKLCCGAALLDFCASLPDTLHQLKVLAGSLGHLRSVLAGVAGRNSLDHARWHNLFKSCVLTAIAPSSTSAAQLLSLLSGRLWRVCGVYTMVSGGARG